MIHYKTRVGGATVTVFVPFDCHNHCPFCINKREYSQGEYKFDMNRIIENIKLMDSITPFCDFVFTGGEPFVNIDGLQKMLDAVPNTHKIFINTTLPVEHPSDVGKLIDFSERNKNKIVCINVSRHLRKYVIECPDSIFNQLKVPCRVNCVLFGSHTTEDLKNFINRFEYYPASIQFRKDYMTTTLDNLNDKDPVIDELSSFLTFDHSTECRMRNGYFFKTDEGQTVSYHRTLPFSIIKEPKDGFIYNVLYDIIIKQNGELHADWDETPLNIDAYKKVVFENE